MALLGSYKMAFSPDLSAFQGIGAQMAQRFSDDFSGESSKTMGKLGKGLGTVAKVGAVGVAAAGTAVVGLGAAALKAQADIQQSLGGSEAVFQGNSDAIKTWAAGAAGDMGMSANAALETANKMGSLFQGSGLSVEQSADMTMQYSQRAADVASVMGVDLSTAMDAVTGAAKGNYTMMDNLGVAMNDTTLKAYAAENGYEKLWSEMSNGEKSQVAYQMFMEKTSQYQGNFAKENSSLSGSFEVLNGSWENVLSSLGDPAMLEGAMSGLTDAIIGVVDSVSAVLPSLVTGMAKLISEGLPVIIQAVIDLIPDLVSMLSELIPQLIQSVIGMIPGLLDGVMAILMGLLPVLLDMIVLLVKSILGFLPEIINQLPMILNLLIPLLVELILALIPIIIETIPLLIMAIIGLIPQLLASIGMIFTALGPMLMQLMISLGEALVNIVWEIAKGIFTFIEGIFPGLLAGYWELLTGFYTVLWDLIVAIGGWLFGWIPTLVGYAAGLWDSFMQASATALSGLWGHISGFFAAIPGYIGAALSGALNIGKDLVMGIWNGIQDMSGWILDKIMGFGATIVDGFKDIFQINSPSLLMEQQVGLFVGQGVGTGILAATDDVLKDAASFSSTVGNSLDIQAGIDYGTDGVFSPNSMGNVVVNQTIEAPKDMLDLYVNTKRGAVAGATALKTRG